MALIKTITLKGYDYNYWTIINFQSDKPSNQTEVILGLFKSKEYYQSLSYKFDDIVSNKRVRIVGYDLKLEQIYPLVKINDEFLAGAEDDL